MAEDVPPDPWGPLAEVPDTARVFLFAGTRPLPQAGRDVPFVFARVSGRSGTARPLPPTGGGRSTAGTSCKQPRRRRCRSRRKAAVTGAPDGAAAPGVKRPLPAPPVTTAFVVRPSPSRRSSWRRRTRQPRRRRAIALPRRESFATNRSGQAERRPEDRAAQRPAHDRIRPEAGARGPGGARVLRSLRRDRAHDAYGDPAIARRRPSRTIALPHAGDRPPALPATPRANAFTVVGSAIATTSPVATSFVARRRQRSAAPAWSAWRARTSRA